jgi:RNA polymerase sigma-70 factor, ECF subfamily
MEIERERLKDDNYRHEILTMLYYDCRTRLYHYCIGWLGRDSADDMLHDVFLTAYETITRIPVDTPPAAWLFGIARNKCQQMLRNRRRRREIVQAFGTEISQTLSADPSEPFLEDGVKREQLAQLADSLPQLDKIEQLLILWRYYQNKPVKEIAEMLAQRENTVSHRILRALQRLRKLMDT